MVRSAFALLLLLPLFTSTLIASTIATVGDIPIDSKQVEYRLATEAAYGNTRMTNAIALVALINETLERQVAKGVGAEATTDEILALSKHADETSKAPAVLAKCKAVFGNDVDSYNHSFIEPKVLKKKLRTYFATQTSIHATERAKIEEVHSLIVDGKSLTDAAALASLEVSYFEVPVNQAAAPAALQEYYPSGLPRNPLVDVLEGMTVGSIHPEILEDERSFRIIRLAEKTESVFMVESITVPKQSFDAWFKAEAAKQSVAILSPALATEIKAKYSAVWWVERLSTD